MKEKIALVSVVVNFFLALGKIVIGIIANSASILAEGIHSGMDIFSSAIGFIGIKLSKKPVDKEHPYGHHKFEVLSGLLITLILFATGIWIVYEAIKNFSQHAEISIGYLAIGIMIVSAIVNEIMARWKINIGKKEDSVALVSDGVHSRVDVYASLAVLIGLLITKYSGWIYADVVLALFIGVYIIKESISLGKEATDSLLDVSAGEEIETKIKSIIKQIKVYKINVLELKTQKRGSKVSANITISLNSKLKLTDVTKITNFIQEKLTTEIDTLDYVAIQVQSHEMKESYFEELGQGYTWRQKGERFGKNKGEEKAGPGGFCVCPKCGKKIKHKRGIPCSTIKCSKCNINLTRK